MRYPTEVLIFPGLDDFAFLTVVTVGLVEFPV